MSRWQLDILVRILRRQVWALTWIEGVSDPPEVPSVVSAPALLSGQTGLSSSSGCSHILETMVVPTFPMIGMPAVVALLVPYVHGGMRPCEVQLITHLHEVKKCGELTPHQENVDQWGTRASGQIIPSPR